MAYFIKLTGAFMSDDRRIFVNVELVENYICSGGRTVITSSSGSTIQVEETPEQIHDLLKSEMTQF
jgi:hypothetical protein